MPTEINGYSPSQETALSSLVINEVDSNETFKKMKEKGILQDNQLYLVTDELSGGVDIPASDTEPATGNYWLDTSAEGGNYYTAGEIDTLLVDKAPAGYGLGEYMPTLISDCNTIRNGWYRVDASTANIPSGVGLSNGVLRIDDASSDLIFQNLYFYSNARTYEMKRHHFSGVWSPWEYVNPPMILGVEYRTTERYLGKSVYAKIVNFGALPNATYRVVPHSISNIAQVINAYGSSGDKPIPTNNFNGTKSYSVSVVADKTDIAILTNFDASAYSANIIVKYTKTTD